MSSSKLYACAMLIVMCGGCTVHELSSQDIAKRREQLEATIDVLSAKHPDSSPVEYIATNSLSLASLPWETIIEQGRRPSRHEWRLICLERDHVGDECLLIEIEQRPEEHRLVSLYELQWEASRKSWYIISSRQNLAESPAKLGSRSHSFRP